MLKGQRSQLEGAPTGQIWDLKQTRLAQTLHDTTYTWNHFMKVKLLETESRKVVTGDWG